MDELQARKESLLAQFATAGAPVPLLHPNLAALYRDKVATLASALQNAESSEAAEALRGLVDAIVLVPAGNELRIELKGNLAAMLSAAQMRRGRPRATSLCKSRWLRGGDLNPRPLGYEPNELPDCSTPRHGGLEGRTRKLVYHACPTACRSSSCSPPSSASLQDSGR
jgi:hypothetical protein